MQKVPDDGNDRFEQKRQAQACKIEQKGQSGAGGIGRIRGAEKAGGENHQLHGTADQVAKKQAAAAHAGPDHMAQQKQSGGYEKTVGIVVRQQPDHHQQHAVHEKGGIMDPFHVTASFRLYYTRNAETIQACTGKTS